MSDKHHSKLHLQLKELCKLHDRIRSSLTEKLTNHLKDIDIKNSLQLSTQITDILAQFLNDLFNAIKYSIELDGFQDSEIAELYETDIIKLFKDPSRLNEKTEPFDFALNDKLRDLYLKVEDKVQEISLIRKSKPNEIYQNYELMIQENETYIDEMINQSFNTVKQIEQKFEAEAEEEDDDDELGDPGIEFNQLQKDFENILKDLVDLKKEIPETKQQMDNMTNVIRFIKQ